MTSTKPSTLVTVFTLTTLVTGPSARLREAAIAAVLAPAVTTALILEGLSDGNSLLPVTSDLQLARSSALPLQIVRIAPACLCCTGNLILRVTLNRILRRAPRRLFISLANAQHIEHLRLFLTQAPYDQYLSMSADMIVEASAST